MAEKAKAAETTSAKTRQTAAPTRTSSSFLSPGSCGIAAIQSAAGNMAIQAAARAEGRKNNSLGQLKIGALNDPQEAEADRVAHHVMNGVNSRGFSRMSAVTSRATNTDVFGGSPGRALDPTSRAFFEPHFGDLSHVRIHDNKSAATTAASIGARSYTTGSDIGFAPGEFAPHTSEGRQLLAHELAHVAQNSSVIRRQPAKQKSWADRPVITQVRRSDIAGYGEVGPEWHGQFDPQRPPVDPTDVDSIEEAQAWVKDLSGFTLDEKRRFKIGGLLKSMIENLPPQVWLPTNEVISKSSSLIVTGTSEPIDTENLRNKLYTRYLSVERPGELEQPLDATGLIWDSDIEQFVTEEEKLAAERYHMSPEWKPYQISAEPFTNREVAILEFLFREEMLEWRRRSVEVKDSVDREYDRRTGVFMGALGDASISFIGNFFKYSFLIGSGMAAAPGISGLIGRALPSFAARSWFTRFLVTTGTGEVLGASTGAADAAITNFADLVKGDMELEDYLASIGEGTWEGAKSGAALGAVSHVASPVVNRFLKWLWPSSKAPAPPGVEPAPTSTPKPAAEPVTPKPARAPVTPKPAPTETIPTVEPFEPVPSTPYSSPTNIRAKAALWFRLRFGEPAMRGFPGSELTPGIGTSNRPIPSLRATPQAGPAASADEVATVVRPATTTSTPQVVAEVPATPAPAPATPAPVAPATQPMRRLPGGGFRGPMSSSRRTVVSYGSSAPLIESLSRSSDPLPDPEYWADPTTPAPAPSTKRQRADTRPWLNEQLERISDPSHVLHNALLVRVTTPTGTYFTWRTHTFTSKKGQEITGRYHGSDEGITIQVGHQAAFASGEAERYMIEDADLNQATGNVTESKGALSFKQPVLVGPPGKEVPVDLASLLLWERLGLVPLGTALNARPASESSSNQ